MSAQPIGNFVAPIVFRAVGLARLQHFLDVFDPNEREQWISDFEGGHTITAEEAELLREHNAAECT